MTKKFLFTCLTFIFISSITHALEFKNVYNTKTFSSAALEMNDTNLVDQENVKNLVDNIDKLETSLLEKSKEITKQNIVIQPIDDYGVDGDFVESQAFAYLAIRSILKEPISFPDTTGCLKPCTGGEIIKFT